MATGAETNHGHVIKFAVANQMIRDKSSGYEIGSGRTTINPQLQFVPPRMSSGFYIARPVPKGKSSSGFRGQFHMNEAASQPMDSAREV